MLYAIAHKIPFHHNISLSSGQKATEFHIFLDHGEHTFCLDGTIYPEQDPFVCGDFFCIIGHIFSTANIIFIFSFLFLFVVRWLYKQGKLLISLYIVVVFFTFIPGIYLDTLYGMDLAQLV